MNKKILSQQIFIIIILIGSILGLGLFIKNHNKLSSVNIENIKSVREEYDKVYSVEEITQILKTNPEFLKNKSIKIKGYIVNGVMGMGCEDYYMLSDYKNVDLYKQKYDKNLSAEEKNKIKEMPILMTGRTLALPKDFTPTIYAIYEGHFYDKWATKKCKDGYNKFVMDKKIQEIIPDKNFANLSETVNSGCVIGNGRINLKPLTITLKDNIIRVNNTLYEPSNKEQIGKNTINTNKQRINEYNNLVRYLKENRIIIYGGNRYESGGGYCEDNKVLAINDIVRGTESKTEKEKKLEKLIGVPAPFVAYDDILKNWNITRESLYHCPLTNEMYQGNHIDCMWPFNTKDYCQENYRKWINKNCATIKFVD